MDLIPKTETENHLANVSSLDALAGVPESSVWLANFTSECTRRTYRQAITEFVAVMDIQDESDWKKIKPAHAIAWRESMKQHEKSKRTIHTRLSALSSLFKHLCEKQIVSENPVRDIKRPKIDVDRVKSIVLTRDQVRLMLDAPRADTLPGSRDRAMLATFFFTGARIESVCALKVGDFFEDRGYMVLDLRVKGGRRKRVAISQELQAKIRVYLETSGHGDQKNLPLFLAVKRKDKKAPLTQRYVRNLFQKYARETGLSAKVVPHSARATFITEALDAGTPIEMVQDTVDHKNIATTRMYDKRKVSYRESASFRVHY